MGTQRLTVADAVSVKKPQGRYKLTSPSDRTALCTPIDVTTAAMAVLLLKSIATVVTSIGVHNVVRSLGLVNKNFLIYVKSLYHIHVTMVDTKETGLYHTLISLSLTLNSRNQEGFRGSGISRCLAARKTHEQAMVLTVKRTKTFVLNPSFM